MTVMLASILLGSPLHFGAKHNFHLLVLIPKLETAKVMPPLKFSLVMRNEMAHSNFSNSSENTTSKFKGTFWERNLLVRGGIIRGLLEGDVQVSHSQIISDEGDIFIFRKKELLTPYERVKSGISGIGAGLKVLIYESYDGTLLASGLLNYRYGLGVDDFLSTGGHDIAVQLVLSKKIKNLFVHVQGGWLMPAINGRQTIPTKSFWFLSSSLCYELGMIDITGSIVGNTSAFKFLNETPLSINIGTRLKFPWLFFEVGGGSGLSRASSLWTFLFAVGTELGGGT